MKNPSKKCNFCDKIFDLEEMHWNTVDDEDFYMCGDCYEGVEELESEFNEEKTFEIDNKNPLQ